MEELISIKDFETKAKEILPTMVYGYFAGGSGDEITLAENQQAYTRIQFQYRVLAGKESCDLSTTVLNQTLSMPIISAPMGFQSMAHPDGEVAMVKATNQQGISAITSTMSNSSLEETAQASNRPLWYQLYIYKDRSVTEALVKRAESAKFNALVVTVDAPVMALRERDIRNHFTLPGQLTIKNLEPYGMQQLGDQQMALVQYAQRLFDCSLSWKQVEWLKSITRLPVLVKGLVHPEDAKKALDHGVDGIIVSNHGGRQLDTSIATINALPQIVNIVKNKVPVLVDGGIQRGTDILKALAIGADAVLIGRPLLWGLAVNGQAGVERVLEIFRKELANAMMLLGFSTIAELKQDGKNYLVFK